MESATKHARAVDFTAALARVHEIGKEVVAPAADDVDRAARFPVEAFAALRDEKLLGAYVPPGHGGLGLTMTQVCRICETLGHYCASTAMIYAMHQIQVACIVHHGSSPYFSRYLGRLADEQLLLASATTELGVGGDLRSSLCSVAKHGERFELTKKAPVISYALDSDAILVTARRSPDAKSSDQVMVLIERDQTELEQITTWDTLGFRGTCSLGFELSAAGHVDQILPAPFSDVLAQSMHPFSHLTWSSLWLGLASSAVQRARESVRKKILDSPDAPPVAALRLAEVDEVLFGMRSGLYETMAEYERLLSAGDRDAFGNFGFSVRVNNVKIICSELVVDVVGKSLQIVGISGYRNDSSSSLCRQLRDAYGAALMVNNDRIRGHNSTMQAAYRPT